MVAGSTGHDHDEEGAGAVTLEVVSLFSGVGGFDLGFERAGMKVVAQAENDPKAAGVLQRHWPNVKLYGDVHDIGKEWAGVDVVCGGFPCQDISVAGKQKGIAHGDKSVLWWEFYRIIEELRPRWVVIENVANLLNINEGRDLGAIIGSLDDLGYMGEWRVLDSQFFGVPQRRRRVFLVGHLGGGGGPAVLLEPESGARGAAKGREARKAVAALTSSGVGTCGADDNQAQAGHLIPARTGTITANWGKGAGNTQVDEGILVPAYAWAENQRAEVRAMDTFGSLSGTGGKPGQGYPAVHDQLGVRRLTPRECERLQGFPDDWTLLDVDGKKVADTHRYRFMGNAVTVNVAEWIGRRLVISDQSVGEGIS
jgi:DNA (cytosine-5)-methyltransferase 1